MKKIICAFLAVLCVATTVLPASATEAVLKSKPVKNTETDEIGTRAMVIVWKFRVNNGVVEKRRWNETIGVWVDPYWIPA